MRTCNTKYVVLKQTLAQAVEDILPIVDSLKIVENRESQTLASLHNLDCTDAAFMTLLRLLLAGVDTIESLECIASTRGNIRVIVSR